MAAAAAGCEGAEDSSQRHHRDQCSCIPEGAGFLNRVGESLGPIVLLNGVHKNKKDSPTLTSSGRRLV
jgi:hypothetical protein